MLSLTLSIVVIVLIISGAFNNNLIFPTLLPSPSKRSLYYIVEEQDNIIPYIIKISTPYKYGIALSNNLLNIIFTIILGKSKKFKKRIKVKKVRDKLNKLKVLVIVKKRQTIGYKKAITTYK